MKFSYHTLIYLIGLTFVLLLDSCRAGKNYQRPDLPLPAQFRGSAPSDSSVADIPWRQFFADTTLQKLIDQALNHNLNMQLALKRVEAASAYTKQARAGLLPSVGINLAAASNIPSKNSLSGVSLETFMGTNHLEDYTTQLTFSWEIDIWGKIRRQKEAAVADYLQSQEAARAVQTQLIADLSQSYFNLLMLSQQLAVARQNQALSDTIVQMMQLQKAAGEVTELAVQQAISQEQTASLLIAELEQEITIQENIIRIIMGELPAPIEQTVRLSDFQVSDQFHTGIPARAISNRPDVRSREMALIAANARVGVAQGSMYPALSITAGGGLNAFKASEWFTVPGSLFGAVAGNLAQPIFQRRALKTQLEVANIRREEALIQFRQSVLDAVGEVSNALIRLEKLDERQRIATNQVALQQEAVHNARMLFQSGLANYLEVITAQSSTLRAELNLASIKRQQLGAMVELYRSLGGGWK